MRIDALAIVDAGIAGTKGQPFSLICVCSVLLSITASSLILGSDALPYSLFFLSGQFFESEESEKQDTVKETVIQKRTGGEKKRREREI